MKGLQGKVALVTGASSGIGRAASFAFAREGARVVVAGKRQKETEETAEAIRNSGGEAVSFKADVRRSSEIEALVQFVTAQYGHLDCAFNNAGITGPLAPTAQCTEDDWDQTIDTNLKGVWLCMRHQIPAMLANGGGVIVNNASAAGVVGLPMQAAYSASKGGVIQLTRTAALEYARCQWNGQMRCEFRFKAAVQATELSVHRAGHMATWAQKRSNSFEATCQSFPLLRLQQLNPSAEPWIKSRLSSGTTRVPRESWPRRLRGLLAVHGFLFGGRSGERRVDLARQGRAVDLAQLNPGLEIADA